LACFVRLRNRARPAIKIAPQSLRSLTLVCTFRWIEALARLVLAICLAAALGLFSRLSWAQDRSTVFYQDPRTPVTIHADRLSVSDRGKTAIFSGNAVVTQGAARMRCARVVVHYHSEGSGRPGVVDRFECQQDYLHLVD
jgi:lipopolysaccharide assembly outer membrane protein LptD (OstA)